MITLQTAIREIVTSDIPLQHYEALHLTGERFKLEKGVWVRRTFLLPREMELVFEVPSRD
jgi:hypothetical protein